MLELDSDDQKSSRVMDSVTNNVYETVFFYSHRNLINFSYEFVLSVNKFKFLRTIVNEISIMLRNP